MSRQGGEDSDPIVRIEYGDGVSSGPEAPRVAETAPRRSAVLILVGLASLVAVLFWLDRDRSDDVAEPVVDPVELPDNESEETVTTDDEATSWQEFVDADLEEQPIGDLLASPVRTDDGWLALRRGQGGGHLVSSTDGLSWAPVDSNLDSGNLFGLTRTDDGGFRTMVNGSAVNQQQYALTAAASADGLDWSPADTVEHQGSGDVPSHVSLRGDSTVVVGDRPLDISVPPPDLAGLVGAYVSPDVAAQACRLVFVRLASEQWFDVVDCDGTVLSRIADSDSSRMNTLSTVAFLMRFQQVVTVQIGEMSMDEVVLEPGNQVVAIEATSSGFLAVVVDALAGIDGANLSDPPAELVRWSRAGGLVTVTEGLDPRVNLTAWWNNDLAIADDGEAFFATSGAVYRSTGPYERWTLAKAAPISGGGGAAVLKMGPDGKGLAYKDAFGLVWLGRVDGDWVRAPQLDKADLRDVLISTDDSVVAVLEFDSFSLRLVGAPLTNTGYVASSEAVEVSAHQLTSIVPFGDGWLGAAIGQDGLVESMNGGLTWIASQDPDGPAAVEGVVAVGTTDEGEARVLRQRSITDPDGTATGRIFETLAWRNNSWVLDPQRPPAVASGTQIVASSVGEETMVVVESAWDEPVPEVSAVLAEFVDADVADATCSIFRGFTDGNARYDLVDCSGQNIGSIGADGVTITSGEDDRLSFAQEVLRSRHTVLVSTPGLGVDDIKLGPSQYVLSIVATDGGFAALILDSVDVLSDPNVLYSQALTAKMISWDRSRDAIADVELPVGTSAWSGNRLVANHDSSITLVTSLGLFRTAPTLDDWQLDSAGPFVRLAPGQSFGSALHGDGFFVDDPGGPGIFWATCCDDTRTSNRSWSDVRSNGRAFSRVLISTDDTLVFHAPDGETLVVQR